MGAVHGQLGHSVFFQVANVVATAVTCGFAFFAWTAFQQGIDPLRHGPIVVLMQAAAYAIAAIACWIAAASVNRQRRWSWVLFASANTLAVVSIPTAILAPQERATLMGLVSFLLVNALGIAGLVLLLPGRIFYQRAASLLLDAAILAGSCFTLVWAYVGRDVYQRAAGAWDRRLLDLSYPFLAVGVLVLVLFILARTPREMRSSLRYIAAGWFVLALSLPVYSYLALHGDLRLLIVGPGGVVVFLMLLVIGAARAAAETDAVPHAEHRPRLVEQFAPYVPFALAIPVVVATYVTRQEYDAPLILASATVVALVFARLGLFLLETRRLRKRLEESAKFKTDMLRFISHEMANPLVPLSVEASLIEQGTIDPNNPQTARNVEGFLRSVKRLEALSKDVRDLARLERGSLSVKPSEHDVRPLVMEAVQAFSAHAAQKELKIEVDVPAEPVPALVDAGRYGQVLDNLLSNAIKFTPRAGHISLKLRADEARHVVAVEDTGLGLSSVQIKQLFHAFSRPHGAVEPGLGLGLVICKAIVAEHGGRIWAESEGLGRGTRFSVSLPRRPPGSSAASQEPPSLAQTSAPTGSSSSL